MTRKKVQLAYIACDSARKSTYKKRKRGLLKKIDELSTLCGVDACAVIYSPYEQEAVVWPDRERARRVVAEFRQLPEMDQHRKMYDHPAYLRQRVTKASQQLARLQRDNREREVALAMYGCISGRRGLEGLSLVDLNDLGWMIDRCLKEMNLRAEALRREKRNKNNSPQDEVDSAGVKGEEVGPNLGHLLELGFGDSDVMQMQLGPTTHLPMAQYYHVAP